MLVTLLNRSEFVGQEHILGNNFIFLPWVRSILNKSPKRSRGSIAAMLRPFNRTRNSFMNASLSISSSCWASPHCNLQATMKTPTKRSDRELRSITDLFAERSCACQRHGWGGSRTPLNSPPSGSGWCRFRSGYEPLRLFFLVFVTGNPQ